MVTSSTDLMITTPKQMTVQCSVIQVGEVSVGQEVLEVVEVVVAEDVVIFKMFAVIHILTTTITTITDLFKVHVSGVMLMGIEYRTALNKIRDIL